MLQIRLSNPISEGGGGAKPLPVDSVTVACPDHLVLADLPVAKSLGSVTAASFVKTVGRRSRRQLGERVHFCVRCDFPIAIYGRLVCTAFELLCQVCRHNFGGCYTKWISDFLWEEKLAREKMEVKQGSLLGFLPGSAGGVNFSDSYPRPWIMGPAGVPFQPYMSGQGSEDGSANMSDSQGRVAFSPQCLWTGSRVLTSNMPNKGMEAVQDVPMEPRDSSNSRGLLAPQALPHPPLPPPPPPHLSQLNRGGSREGQNFGWQNDKRDTFGSGQDL